MQNQSKILKHRNICTLYLILKYTFENSKFPALLYCIHQRLFLDKLPNNQNRFHNKYFCNYLVVFFLAARKNIENNISNVATMFVYKIVDS